MPRRCAPNRGCGAIRPTIPTCCRTGRRKSARYWRRSTRPGRRTRRPGPDPLQPWDNGRASSTANRPMISNELDIEPYRARLRALGRVQIPGFLQEDAAQRLHGCLRDEVPWETAQRTDAPPLPGLPAAAPAGTAEEAARMQAVGDPTGDGIECYYAGGRMTDARPEGKEPHVGRRAVADLVNSEPFLQLAPDL